MYIYGSRCTMQRFCVIYKRMKSLKAKRNNFVIVIVTFWSSYDLPPIEMRLFIYVLSKGFKDQFITQLTFEMNIIF